MLGFVHFLMWASPFFYKVALTAFGLSGGLSFFAMTSILLFRLTSSGVPVDVVGLFALSHVPYSVRLFWPFLIDSLPLPYLTKKFGQRKGWGLLAHVLSCVGFIVLGFASITTHFSFLFLATALMAFFSSLQDVVSDMCRFDCEKAFPTERSVPLNTFGFRCGQGAATVLIPILAGFWGWGEAHLFFIVFKILAFFLFLYFPETKTETPQKTLKPSFWKAPSDFARSFQKTFCPFFHTARRAFSTFFSQPVLPLFLLSLVFLKAIDVILGPMQPLFMGHLGISGRQFGAIKNGPGVFALLLGAVATGYLVRKISLFRILAAGAFFQSLAALLSLFLLTLPLEKALFPYALAGISFCQEFFLGIMNTMYIIYISSFKLYPNRVYSFVFFSTLGSLSRICFTSFFGYLASLSWPLLFFLPSLFLLCLIPLLKHLLSQPFFVEMRQNPPT